MRELKALAEFCTQRDNAGLLGRGQFAQPASSKRKRDNAEDSKPSRVSEQFQAQVPEVFDSCNFCNTDRCDKLVRIVSCARRMIVDGNLCYFHTFFEEVDGVYTAIYSGNFQDDD